MARLVCTAGASAGDELELGGDGILIGRNAECQLVIKDSLVSSRHAELRPRSDGRWGLTDLDSSNGTLVNGQLIRSVVLVEGDTVQLGAETFLFKADVAAPAPSEPEPGPPPATAEVKRKRLEADAAASRDDLALVEQMRQRADAIRREVGKTIVGQQDVLDQILMVLIAGGHGLLVGMPGMAKTLMVRTIARALDMDFKRIQFTPDLMPTDITGTEVLETNRTTMEKEFRFMRGPIFTNLLLADEINRTPPKTQAALLEAMQEHCVTVGGENYRLPEPFFVLATQNPIEQEGTYPLPEAQMDRFMFFIWVDYPLEHEEEIIISTTTAGRQAEPSRVLSRDEVLKLQEVVRKIPVSEHVVKYATRLVRATRPKEEKAPDFIKQYVHVGSGPRAGQFLVLAAKARAVLEGRIHVSCADVKRAALPVLRHRIYTNFAADSEGVSAVNLVERLLESVEEPGEADYPA